MTMDERMSGMRKVPIQVFLFDYLTEEQQLAVRPILRVLKKESQEKLCVALIDYMEFGEAEEPAGYLLRMAFRYLTDADGQEHRQGVDPQLHHQ